MGGIKAIYHALVPEDHRKWLHQRFDNFAKRWFWLILGLSFYIVWNGHNDVIQELTRQGVIFEGSKQAQTPASPTSAPSLTATNSSGSTNSIPAQPPQTQDEKDPLSTWEKTKSLAYAIFFRLSLKLLMCFTMSFFVVCAAQGMYSQTSRENEDEFTKKIHFFGSMMIDDVGITTVHTWNNSVTIKEQDYTKPILLEAKNSKIIKILTIAGHQWLGTKEDSLLYSALKNSTKKIDVILLNPDSNDGVIKERADALKSSDSNSVTEESIRTEIKDTLSALAQLGAQNLRIKVCKKNPIFRLIIFDNSLYVSCYPHDNHGHIAPMIRISRTTKKLQRVPWYDAFEKYFDQTFFDSTDWTTQSTAAVTSQPKPVATIKTNSAPKTGNGKKNKGSA